MRPKNILFVMLYYTEHFEFSSRKTKRNVVHSNEHLIWQGKKQNSTWVPQNKEDDRTNTKELKYN